MGLGNPDPAYRNSPHNAGFECIRLLQQRLSPGDPEDLGTVILRRGGRKEREFILARPLTWMNRSGAGVVRLLRYLEADVSRLVVITDDMDLPLGEVRVRPGGGAGTHRGMQSVTAALGREDFARIRIGIQPDADGPADLAAYVLTPMEGRRLEELQTGVERAAAAAQELLSCGDIHAVMNRYNRRVRRRGTPGADSNALFAPRAGGCRSLSGAGAAAAASIQKEDECNERTKSGLS